MIDAAEAHEEGNQMDRESILKALSDHRHVLQKYGVKSIRLFGSFARGDAAPGSDVDLLVEFEPAAHVGLFEFIRLKNDLSDLLACEVDLATPNALHHAMRDEILKEAILAA